MMNEYESWRGCMTWAIRILLVAMLFSFGVALLYGGGMWIFPVIAAIALITSVLFLVRSDKKVSG